MKQIVLASILAITLMPALSFADNDNMEHPRPPMGTGAMMGSGKILTSSGMIDRDVDGLKKAMEKLTPEQRIELTKLIRAFLESKGIQLPTPSENKDQIKEVRNEMKDNAKILRKKTQEEIKAQRELMREKIKSLREKN